VLVDGLLQIAIHVKGECRASFYTLIDMCDTDAICKRRSLYFAYTFIANYV